VEEVAHDDRERQVAALVLSGDLEPSDKVKVDADGDDLRFDAEKGGASDLLQEEQEQAPEPAASPV
jgi:hypothetical protein